MTCPLWIPTCSPGSPQRLTSLSRSFEPICEIVGSTGHGFISTAGHHNPGFVPLRPVIIGDQRRVIRIVFCHQPIGKLERAVICRLNQELFDDGRQTFIEFPESVAQGQMPPLLGLGEGNQAELLNYRVSGRFMIVDRLLERAELRLGDRRSQQRVEIRKERRRTPS